MAFFTRPDFDERQFKQLTGATITLSGETNFSGTLKSKGIEIDASTGGTGNTGHVLTYNSGIINLQPSTGGSGDTDSTFDGERSITQTLSPPSAAGDLNTTGLSQFIEAFFFPDVPPIILTFNTTGATSDRQFGDSGDTSTNVANVIRWDVRVGTNDLTSLTVNGQSITPLAGVTGDTGGTVSYAVSASDYNPVTGETIRTTNPAYSMLAISGSLSDNDTETITWRHKRFWFKSNTKYLVNDDTILEGILNTGTTLGDELSATRVKIFNTIDFSNEYFYYAYPLQFGVPAFTVNGLPNNAWGDAPSNLFTFLYTNTDGYTESYYLASSDNRLNTTFNISVA